MLGKGKAQTVPSDAQAQEKLALYVYEYLIHMGANKTAQSFLSETRLDKNITLGDAPGFLCSWWCVFWDLYCAAPERRDNCDHTSEAKAFHDYGFVGPHPGGGMCGPGGLPPGAGGGGGGGSGGPSPMPPSDFFPGGPPGPQGPPGPMPVDIRGSMPMEMRGPSPGMMARGGPGVMGPRMAPGVPMGYRPRPGGWPGPMGPMPPGPGPQMSHPGPPGPPTGPPNGPPTGGGGGGPPSAGPYSVPSPYSAPVGGPGTPGGIMPSPQDPNANCESMYGPPRPMSSMSAGGGHQQFMPDSDPALQQQQQQQQGMNGVGSSPHPNIPAVSDYLHFSEPHFQMQPGPPLQSHQQAILQQQQQQQPNSNQNDSAKILKIKESMREESERLFKKEGQQMETDIFGSQ